jgi:hypothetical protein
VKRLCLIVAAVVVLSCGDTVAAAPQTWHCASGQQLYVQEVAQGGTLYTTDVNVCFDPKTGAAPVYR